MPTWLGIDIGSESVKAALVRSTYRKVSLGRLATASVADSGGVAEAIRAVTALALEGETQALDGAATAVDGSKTAIHRIQLPATAQKELASVMAFELEAQVPFDLEGAVFDWHVLGRRAAEGQLSIVAAVARLDDVRARIDVVREAIAQEPERVAVGSLVLGALLPHLPGVPTEGALAIVDLGAKASDVVLVENGEVVFARALSCGTEGLPATASRLAREIRVSFAAHQAQGGAAPGSVWICGGGAYVSGAEGFLAGELEVPVHRLPDPALEVAVVEGQPPVETARYAKAIALAIGLAGKGESLNLRRGPLTFERGFGWVRERVPMLAGLAAVMLVSFVFSAWARLHEAHMVRDSLESALGQVTKEVLGTEATTAQDAQDLLAKQAALTDEDPMPHADAFDVMVQLSQAVPSTVKHDVEELDVQREKISVRGLVGSIPEAQSIASSLGEVRCMNDVKIKSTSQSVGGDRQKYVMELELKCPEDVKATGKKKGDKAEKTDKSDTAAAAGSGGK
jgi:general secretion pathway protein L